MENSLQKQSPNQQLQYQSGTETKPFLNIKDGSEDEKSVKREIALHALVFIKSSYPATDAELVSKEFAKEIYLRKDWNVEEVKKFFRFIKDNPKNPNFEVLGNSIGMMHFMKFIVTFEEHRSEARESQHQHHKIGEPNTPLPIPKEHYEKIMQTIKSATVKPEYTGKAPIIHNAFDPIKNLEHFEQFKQLITDSTPEEKEKWRKSIVVFESIDGIEMQRKTELLKLLQ